MEIAWQRVAAYVICRDDDGRLLLTQFEDAGHPESGKWTLPGGGMEWQEQAIDTAHRELYEETGLTATIGPVLRVFSGWFDSQTSVRGAPGQAVAVMYAASNPVGELKTDFSDDETIAAGWFTLAQAAELPHVRIVAVALDVIA